jgi:hypothetical protein
MRLFTPLAFLEMQPKTPIQTSAHVGKAALDSNGKNGDLPSKLDVEGEH